MVHHLRDKIVHPDDSASAQEIAATAVLHHRDPIGRGRKIQPGEQRADVAAAA